MVLWRQPRNACGWVLLSAALVAVSVLAHEWAYDGGTADPGSLPLVSVAVWLSSWTYVPYWLQLSLLPVLFPDGRLPSAGWKRFVSGVLGVTALLTVVAMLKPDPDVEGLGMANPLGLFWLPAETGPYWVAAQIGCVLVLMLVGGPLALVAMTGRMRRSAGRERAQLQWLLLGLVVALVLTAVSAVLDDGEVVFAVGFAAIPLSLVVAVLRHHLLDIQLVVNRTIVYAVLTGAGVVAYVALVALTGRYVGTDGAGPVIAAALVALAASGRTRLQQLVDRRLFGARRDPYALVQKVGASTSSAGGPVEALGSLVRAVQESLRLPFVQVLDEDGEPAAEAGAPVAGTHVLPVVDRGRQLGVLVIGRRSKSERLRPEEHSALLEVARRAGSLLSTRQLTTDLQRSFEQVVQAREHERRRLRRDLHDGVGPALAGVALQLDSLAGRLTADPGLAQRAERLRDRLLDTVGDVRDIVDGLRPAALDELGLAVALQSLATEAGDGVQVLVTTSLPERLPAAVEVAAYRIAGEAVTNVLRHAQAGRAVLHVHAAGGRLHVEVTDDGRGFGADVTAGVGLRSMHERAAEVGGCLHVHSEPGVGTAVRAELPVRA